MRKLLFIALLFFVGCGPQRQPIAPETRTACYKLYMLGGHIIEKKLIVEVDATCRVYDDQIAYIGGNRIPSVVYCEEIECK